MKEQLEPLMTEIIEKTIRSFKENMADSLDEILAITGDSEMDFLKTMLTCISEVSSRMIVDVFFSDSSFSFKEKKDILYKYINGHAEALHIKLGNPK